VRRRGARFAILVAAASLAPGAAAQESIVDWPREVAEPERLELSMVDPTSRIATITAADGSPGRTAPSGLFVVDGTGQIAFRSDAREGSPARSLPPLGSFDGPSGLEYVDPRLYVYDHATRRIWAVDLAGDREDRRALELGHGFGRPTHLAVSPHGLIAVTEGEGLFFLQEGHEPIPYEQSLFPDPVGLVFSSWDTVLVMDRDRGSLVTITLTRLKDGSIEFLREKDSQVPPPDDSEWRVMTAFEGTAYLVSGTAVYAWIEADAQLIPVASLHPEHREVRQIALSRETLYLLDGDHLDTLPRPQPVDLALEGGPAESGQALAAFYRYLRERNLLPVRRILARRTEPLESLLLAEGVLVAASSLAGDPEIRVYDDLGKGSVRQSARKGREEAPERPWQELVCDLNEGLCRAGGEPGELVVDQGRELTVPDLRIDSRLGRERILLEGRPLGWYLERLVFSPEFVARAQSPDLIRTLNPNLEGLADGEIAGLTAASVVVPAEKWQVTAAVPAADYADRESPLWRLVEGFERVSVFSREGYVELEQRSMQPPDDPVEPPSGDDPAATARAELCETLRTERSRWREAIKYPLAAAGGGATWPAVPEAPVLVGVLEHGSTVARTHQIFGLDPERPSWFTAKDLVLTPLPEPASFEAGSQVIEDVETFSPEAHHGTHVAALIAGREGECWSGLAPSARLVLIDLTDGSAVRWAILDAASLGAAVFNISQKLSGPQADLHDTIRLLRRSLFVAAAGNSGEELLDAASVAPPAIWGARSNVVVVAASDWNGTILPRLETPEGVREGSNFGSRYVDLVAPGEEILSASAQRRYGRATGTSQAAPQVAAAAALLVGGWRTVVDGVEYGSPMLDPGDAKARLIATARWRSDYEGKVWGGMLDFGSAVMFPQINHLRTTTGAQTGRFHTFTAANDPLISIANAPQYYERFGPGAIAPDKIPFSRILSLHRRPDGRYRMVLKEPRTNRLKILLGAVLEDQRSAVLNRPVRIECASFKALDSATGTFTPDAGCDGGLSVTQIQEYVLGEDYQIDWEE